MSISERLSPYIFRRKIENTRLMQEEMEGKVFISRQSRHFSFIFNMIKVLFSVCTLIWRVSKNVCAKEKVIIGETKALLLIILEFFPL